jgi:16S rRNA (guanine966-N2)-methyltransferase
MNSHSSNKNQFRIIAGKWRSRKLSFPGNVDSLRPTTDRIRETVFNWLQLQLPGARCLDLFAGSGALSFEACSRQAESVICLDKSVEATTRIAENCKTLGCDNMEVITADALKWLDGTSGLAKFDLVFLDPPFSGDLLNQCITQLDTGHFLSQGARIYIESGSPLDSLETPKHWNLLKQKKGGQVYFGVYESVRQ